MGITSVNFGIETFHRDTGRMIGKGGDPALLKDTLFKLKAAWGDDTYVSGNFIVGLPGEPIESIRDTFEWLYREDCPLDSINVNRFVPSNHYPAIQQGEHTDDQMRAWGFIRSARGWQFQNINRIEEKPEKFNIKLGDANDPNKRYQWQSDIMDRNLARSLVNEFYRDHRCERKYSLAMFQNYNRIKNIGYTHGEIKHLYQNDITLVESCLDKREALMRAYLAKVL